MRKNNLSFKRMQHILAFLDREGWPNPNYNFDIELVDILSGFMSSVLKDDFDMESVMGEGKKFNEVDLETAIKVDSDGMPTCRDCFEYETLMSFYSDDDNTEFKEWWDKKGAYFFNEWLKRNE